MAKKSVIEEEVLKSGIYGDGDPVEEPQNPDTPGQQEEGGEEPGGDTPIVPGGDSSTGDSSTGDSSTGADDPAEEEEGTGIAAGFAQAANMQITTTVGNTIPQVDTTKYAVRSRFTQNGKNAGANSEFAVKATSEGAGFKPTKDVSKKAFPETGAAYKEVVNTNSY